MAGLQLVTSLRGGIISSPGYAPLTPASATAAGTGSTTIGQRAYGISGSGVPSVNALPGYGTLVAGMVGAAFLVFLWFTLPQ